MIEERLNGHKGMGEEKVEMAKMVRRKMENMRNRAIDFQPKNYSL